MSVADDAKRIYERDLKIHLQHDHYGRFVAIEPRSHDYFLGETFLDAALATKKAHPEETSFVLRIGYDATFHLGGCAR